MELFMKLSATGKMKSMPKSAKEELFAAAEGNEKLRSALEEASKMGGDGRRSEATMSSSLMLDTPLGVIADDASDTLTGDLASSVVGHSEMDDGSVRSGQAV